MLRDGHLAITVAALTRSRPKMLGDLLASLGEMELPENTTVTCLIVENDTVPRSKAVVQSAGPLANGAALDYTLEPEPGIPFGRNCAARHALSNRHDLLAFIDDDEIVAKDWLVRLIDAYRRSDAVLIGGPLRIAPAVKGIGLVQRVMYRNLAERYRKKEQRAAARASDGQPSSAKVVTNNWLGETRLFSEYGIWFDEEMRYTGGTDSKFCQQVVAAGLPVAWVPDAFVYEIIPAERLSFWYQYRRARDQTNTAYLRAQPEQRHLAKSLLLRVPVRVLESLLLTLMILPTGGRSLHKLARRLGWVVGTIISPLGYRSRLYEAITGS